MDLDNIDNVVRLAFHVGITEDSDRRIPISLAQTISLVDGELVIPSSATTAICRWQEIRTRLYNLLLHDWAEFSAKAMLTKAIEIAISYNAIGADSWVMTDSGFLDYLEQKAIGEMQSVKELVRRLRRGELYTPIALYQSPAVGIYSVVSSTDVKLAIESEIARRFKGRGIKPLVHFILDQGKTERGISVRISESGDRICIGKNSIRLLAGLFISNPRVSDADRNSLAEQFAELLIERGAHDVLPIPDPIGDRVAIQQLSLL